MRENDVTRRQYADLAHEDLRRAARVGDTIFEITDVPGDEMVITREEVLNRAFPPVLDDETFARGPEERAARIKRHRSREQVIFFRKEQSRVKALASDSIIVIDSKKRNVEPLELFLRAIRKKHNVSQTQMAELASIDPRRYAAIERGTIVKPSLLDSAKIIDTVKTMAEEDNPYIESVTKILNSLAQSKRGKDLTSQRQHVRTEVAFQGFVIFLRDGEAVDLRSDEQKWYQVFDRSDM